MRASDSQRALALAEQLIALPSVSPDLEGEARCAAAIRAALPAGLDVGEWNTPDGRPVLWALVRGASPRTVALLTHYDTVGVEEFRALGDRAGEAIAFRPDALRDRLLALDPERLPAGVRADLEQERGSPGTWLFGRGALDMKSGIAAGLVALDRLAAERDALEGNVLFVACPDEENQSAGMLRAVPEIAALAERLRFLGALSLDYVERPTAFDGVVGKRLVGLFVIGHPTHVGNPFAGADAAQLAAAIVDRVTTSPNLVEPVPGAVPPVALRMRDVKPRYDVQTALEAEVELNLLAFERPLGETIERLRGEIVAALDDVAARMARLKGNAANAAPASARVLTYAELAGASLNATAPPTASPRASDPRLACWRQVRDAARAAGLVGPAVVIALLPPYYPQSPPRRGGLGERLGAWLEAQGVGMERWYRYISDASYLAWRGDPPPELESLMPSWGREYRLPVAECSALDLDVVTLGPWGRDAHGLFERVERRFAFDALPGLIAGAVHRVLQT